MFNKIVNTIVNGQRTKVNKQLDLRRRSNLHSPKLGYGSFKKLRAQKLISMILKCTNDDVIKIYEIINDAASLYKGVIPFDCWHDPYMSEEELKRQIDDGVEFWCYRHDNSMVGVMGIQDKGAVTLIRHAYVRTAQRNKGVGSHLLKELLKMTGKPVLVGTWADAKWAIEFYRKHDFRLLSKDEKNDLLRRYWSIPGRQMQSSVVLANSKWKES